MDFNEITKNLENRGYKVSCFDTAREATDYLDAQIDKKSVGFGGSVTEIAVTIATSPAEFVADCPFYGESR